MTRTEIRNEVRKLIRQTDSNNTYYSDTEINDTINRVMPGMAMELETTLLTYADYTTSTTVARYALKADFLKVKQVELQITTSLIQELTYLDTKQFQQHREGAATQTGVPEYYTIEHGSVLNTDTTQIPGDIWVWPAPDTNGGSNYTLRIRYYQMPDSIADGSGTDGRIPEFPLYVHQAIAYRAASDLMIKGGDLEGSSFLERKYNDEIFKAKRFKHIEQRDRHRGVKDVMGYGSLD